MSAAVIQVSTSNVADSKWIIGKRDDLTWFLGSSLLGYAALAVLSLSDNAALSTLIAVLWGTFINGPHFYATATRTYFDKNQREKLRYLLLLIVPFTLLPFLAIALVGRTAFFVFAIAWGTYHITKQHFGMMMLYKRVNGERSKIDFKLDRWFLIISQCLPLSLFLLWYAGASTRGLLQASLAIQTVIILAYIARQIVKYNRGEVMTWPKLMLLALTIPLHWLAFIIATNDPVSGIFLFTIGVNMGHALQYHRLTWFHNRNRYEGKTGFAAFLGRKAGYYYIASLTLYLTFLGLGSLLPSGGSELLLAGPVFMHYILDAKIWKVREDPELAKALRLA